MTMMRVGFSALQRAENSSMPCKPKVYLELETRFSALQRAENSSILLLPFCLTVCLRFSALQRAENSSIKA